MTLDGKTTKTKVVDLDEIYNFVVTTISLEIIYSLKFVSEVLKFKKTKIFKQPRMENLPKAK